MAYIASDNAWLVATIEWLSAPESNGGITTCSRHRGIGFTSDCAVCSRLGEIKGRIDGEVVEKTLTISVAQV